MKRKLRDVFVMVDGGMKLVEISKQIGDRDATEAVLRKLEKAGLIEKLVVPTQHAEAGEHEDVPVLTKTVASPVQVHEEMGPTGSPMLEYESMPPSPPPAFLAAAPAVGARRRRIKTLFAQARALAAVTKQPVPGSERRASRPRTRMTSIGTRKKTEDGVMAYQPAPSRRVFLEQVERERRSGWPTLTLSALAGSVVLLTLVLLLYPYGHHVSDIERNASVMMQDRVKIGDIGLDLLPTPHIVLRDIEVGGDAPYLRIAEARATPELLSLLREKKVFRELSLDKVAVSEAGIGRLARAVAGTPSVDIRRIALNDLALSIGGELLEGFDGEVDLTAMGAVEAIDLRNAGETLKVRLQPQDETYRVTATGNDWRPSFKPDMKFEWLEAEGDLRSGNLDLHRIDMRAYGGLLTGKAALSWAGGAMLAGDIELKHENASELLAAIGSDLIAEGDLNAHLKLAAKADTLAGLVAAVYANGDFKVDRGTAKGFNLAEATHGPVWGGETKFKQLSGSVVCDPDACRLGDLRLTSGLLTAAGNLVVARAGSLSGAMQVDLKGSVTTLGTRLAIGGSAKNPLLTPGMTQKQAMPLSMPTFLPTALIEFPAG
ncbi:MAG: hypothetical protein LBE33_05215 [Zoogloeaceae bacterium]|nr:hypothetical protein [Zoogloeaceae bacterium]